MKQTKKIGLKELKKLAKKDLENQFISTLKAVVGTTEKGQKKIDSIIAKNSKQLVKKLYKYVGKETPFKNVKAGVIKPTKEIIDKAKVEEGITA